MYAWRIETLVTGGQLAGKEIQSITVTSTTAYEDAILTASNLNGVVKEANLLGYIPGVAPSTLPYPRVTIIYGIITFKFPILPGSSSSVRQVIDNWDYYLDLNIGKAWKPELAIGPLPPEEGDPPEIGRVASLASVIATSSYYEQFVDIMSSEVFNGTVPTSDIRVIMVRDASLLVKL